MTHCWTVIWKHHSRLTQWPVWVPTVNHQISPYKGLVKASSQSYTYWSRIWCKHPSFWKWCCWQLPSVSLIQTRHCHMKIVHIPTLISGHLWSVVTHWCQMDHLCVDFFIPPTTSRGYCRNMGIPIQTQLMLRGRQMNGLLCDIFKFYSKLNNHWLLLGWNQYAFLLVTSLFQK